MKIIDGKKISNQIKDEIKKEVDFIIASNQKVPHLAAVLVGEDGASLTYVGSKVRSCKQVGFDSTLIRLPSTITESSLIEEINKLTNNKLIDGFIVQLPLPKHIDEEKILTSKKVTQPVSMLKLFECVISLLLIKYFSPSKLKLQFLMFFP